MQLLATLRRPSLVSCLFLIAAASPATSQSELFTESGPVMSLPGSGEEAVILPMQNPSTGELVFPYAPPEVVDAHPAQVLTVFLPEPNPPHDKKFPTVIYSTASVFQQGVSGSPQPGFLRKACDAGYVVITVATTGHNSWPTCSQPVECTTAAPNFGPDPGCEPTMGACWDPNLWYEPDASPNSPWNDFNYFYGEKDFVWAVQYVKRDAVTANMFHVDASRIIVSGTSTGGIYAAFVAFGPNRAWSTPLSYQVQTDTRVAGIVGFEPVVWMPAYPPTNPGDTTFPYAQRPSLHFPTVETPSDLLAYHSYHPILEQAPIRSLATVSTSRLVRESTPRVPAFFASGDGMDDSTGFGRDGNLPEHLGDYDRYQPGEPSPDSLLDYAPKLFGASGFRVGRGE